MSQLADGLTAIGDNYALLLVGAIELIAAVMFILGRILKNIHKITKINRNDMENVILREMDEWVKEAYVLFRRNDMLPVYATGNLKAFLGISLQDLQEDIANLKTIWKKPDVVEKLWKDYQTWDGTYLLERQVQLKSGQWIQITVKRSNDGVYDQISFMSLQRYIRKWKNMNADWWKQKKRANQKLHFCPECLTKSVHL